MKHKKHWQPKMDKSYLIDDLNDFMVDGKIEYETGLTVKEIEALLHSFEEQSRRTKATGEA